MHLTDTQWAVLAPLIPTPPRRPDGRGRPWRDSRAVLDGILWVLTTGARWHDLPDHYPRIKPVIAAISSGSRLGCSRT